MFRSFQIIIREFRRSLLKLLHIHDLVRFCKQGVVAVVLSVLKCFKWKLYRCICWLIVEVIL